jgi:cell division protein FtsQ
MIKRIFHIVLWITLLAWLTLFTGFIAGKNDQVLCKRLVIDITDSTQVKFVTANTITEMISRAGFEVQGYPVSSIPTRAMEELIVENPYVKSAEVYVNIEGDLRIDIVQRSPMVRILPDGSSGFYLDREGVVLPLSERFAPMVLPVTGPMDMKYPEPGTRLADVREQLEKEGAGFIYEVLEFSDYVTSDPFWSKQFVQLYRNRKGEYELIPRVGAHHILLGTMDHYREKLRNLGLLYEQGFGSEGWNRYNKINLKYSNQVICTKR